MNKTNEGKKKQAHLQMNARRNQSQWSSNKRKMYLVGVDLQSSVSEQCFVAAFATAALNASCSGWFHCIGIATYI